ncbi:Adenylate cyclase [Candidatus Arsenophonus lipoptenae]|uniref:Adenylate cyclase n=1 Tax=Candidatus Arsenophonus lipoptenae TaxID=634113 RepID=A0A120HPY0_9GAMM|nr:class I adenylate cyclase [Candidatus Arsenophonus lipoptenae]AMA65146.1 Adenylate cyclase [Candidatus Arsenophonus lipoptenae]
MYIHLEILKQRLDSINQLRLIRAYSSMSDQLKIIYELLPILLNYHHPILPGYIEGDVPVGICFFVPDTDQINWLKQFDINFYFEPILYKNNSELPIIGIYSMGSTSSIGQNNNSDLDIWICHQSWLNKNEKKLLQKKCTLIKKWISSFGVDVTLFLIDENLFHDNISNSIISDSEHKTRTIQYILLLDEFYRTSVRIAGKRLLWMIIPVEEEKNYDEYVLLLYAQGILLQNEWLNLGGLGKLSLNEYLRASIYQLYNSTNFSYKTILKSILLESYFMNSHYGELLSIEFKKRLHAGQMIYYGLDAYCLMLERVTCYLININDFALLDIIRCCFYLKVNEKLSDKNNKFINNNWRKHVLSQLVISWKWNIKKLRILDNKNNYIIDQYQYEYKKYLQRNAY